MGVSRDVPNLEVFGFVFGSRPDSPAFGPGGELEVDTGRFARSAYLPGGAELSFPIDDSVFKWWPEGYNDFFRRPKDRGKYGWVLRMMTVHYTPRSRRADAVEVFDHYICKHGDLKESFVREHENDLANAVRAKYPQIDASVRYVRLTNQYRVITRLEYRPLRAVGAAECGIVVN